MDKSTVERTSTAWQPTGGGEMGALIRAHDWAATLLGPAESWPQSLKTAVQTMLESPFPNIVLWGPELVQIYNDGHRGLMGIKHPAGLGQPTRECWPEAWHINSPMYERVWRGESLTFEDALYSVIRSGVLADAWFTFAYSPIRDEAGAVAGVLVTAVETTGRLHAEGAQQSFLLELSDALRPLDDPIDVQGVATRLLGVRLGASRTYYVEYDPETGISTVARDYVADGSPSLVGRYDHETYRTVLERIGDGRTWIVEDVNADADLAPEERELLTGQGVIAWVDVPLVKHGQLVAVLCVVQSTARLWTEIDIALVEAVAERTWAAVERARAEEALRASEECNVILLRFADVVRGLSDPVRVAEEACRLLAQQLGTDDTLWAVIDWATREYVPECRVVSGDTYIDPIRWPLDPQEPFASEHLDGSSVVYDDVETDSRIPEPAKVAMIEHGMRSGVAVPVMVGDRLDAVLSTSQSTPRRWLSNEVAFAEALARRAWAEIQRTRAEAALRESEENFRSVANVVPDLLWYGEADGSTTWYNERWMEYTGQSVEQAIGWGWMDAIHPEDRESSTRRYREAVEAGTPLQQEHRIRRHDGHYCWFLVRAQPSVDGSGRVIRIYGAATNIDEARAAREQLESRVAERTSQLAAALEDVRSSEERLRLLLQQVPAMLWATDRELRITTLMGADVPVEEVPRDGRTVDDLFAEVDANGTAALHRRALVGKSAEFEFHIDSHTYEAHLEPLRDADGQTIGTIGVAYDVTDRTLRRMQEDFIASVSHELQTPLTSVRAGLGLLDAAIGDTLGPAERELLSASRRNAERLRLEIGQLLAANQLTTSGPKVERARIDLHGLVDEAVRSLQTLAEEKDQTVTVDMADRLEVEGDRRLLEQVLANLLSNAHRHTPPGTAITVSGWFVGNDVRLAVHDTGPGIPPDQLEAIFQRFYRSPGSRREGIGLGLAITRDAVGAQGGRVWAESVLGMGTTFFVSLPRARDTHPA